ncbi:MAG: glycosyltransferase family 39 protein [Candidatus Omnitrophica bacterium]|nr:glycosyltransferase family 39 protein [Candidatus Omnitrophota bacterium]
MKENDFLSIAENMRDTGDFISRKVYFFNAFEPDTQIKIFPQPPLISYQILASWNIIGRNLWGPRLINVLFGIISILAIYRIALLLFQDLILALFCAFLLAIMPLAVFFSRNLQPESPAFFFMLVGNLFYLEFAYRHKKNYLILGGIAFFAAWLYKFSFIFGALPFLFLLPFKYMRKNKKAVFSYLAYFILPYSFIILTIIWLKLIGQWHFVPQLTLDRIKIFDLFSPAYWNLNWRIVWWYIQGENFTIVFTFLAICGVIIASLGRKEIVGRYIIGWAFTIVPYSMIFSDYINQHNYYQMPFLGMVCIASVYAVLKISKIIGMNMPGYLISLIIVLSAMPVCKSIYRMYATNFWGVDVAGNSLKKLTLPGERLFLSTHSQGLGIATYAQRYSGWPVDLADFKEKEAKFKIRYICIYPALYFQQLESNSPEIARYIQDNYHPKELGLLGYHGRLEYLILEKGGTWDPKDYLEKDFGYAQLKTVYRLFGKRIPFYTVRLNGPNI